VLNRPCSGRAASRNEALYGEPGTAHCPGNSQLTYCDLALNRVDPVFAGRCMNGLRKAHVMVIELRKELSGAYTLA
jgi:hypothetical protein